jgi:hypothetical protein
MEKLQIFYLFNKSIPKSEQALCTYKLIYPMGIQLLL